VLPQLRQIIALLAAAATATATATAARHMASGTSVEDSSRVSIPTSVVHSSRDHEAEYALTQCRAVLVSSLGFRQ
jgi:hypothetical protein